MARLISFTVPGELPALNEKLNTKKVMYCAMGETLNPFDFVDIRVKWYCKDRRKDKDNIAAGMKFILDGLVAAKVIPNDTWEYVKGFSHEFAVDKDDPRIEIEVEEAKGARI